LRKIGRPQKRSKEEFLRRGEKSIRYPGAKGEIRAAGEKKVERRKGQTFLKGEKALVNLNWSWKKINYEFRRPTIEVWSPSERYHPVRVKGGKYLLWERGVSISKGLRHILATPRRACVIRRNDEKNAWVEMEIHTTREHRGKGITGFGNIAPWAAALREEKSRFIVGITHPVVSGRGGRVVIRIRKGSNAYVKEIKTAQADHSAER